MLRRSSSATAKRAARPAAVGTAGSLRGPVSFPAVIRGLHKHAIMDPWQPSANFWRDAAGSGSAGLISARRTGPRRSERGSGKRLDGLGLSSARFVPREFKGRLWRGSGVAGSEDRSCGTVTLWRGTNCKTLALQSNRAGRRRPTYRVRRPDRGGADAVEHKPIGERMSVRFRLDVALYIADAARVGRKVTYGELTARFGESTEGWGAILAAIASGLHKRGCPLLPVLVVAVDTGLPSMNAAIYRQFGLSSEEAIRREQQKCHEFDWPAVFFCLEHRREAPRSRRIGRSRRATTLTLWTATMWPR